MAWKLKKRGEAIGHSRSSEYPAKAGEAGKDYSRNLALEEHPECGGDRLDNRTHRVVEFTWVVRISGTPWTRRQVNGAMAIAQPGVR